MKMNQEETINRNGQAYRLKKISSQSKRALILGVVSLVIFFAVVVIADNLSSDQLESTMFLNQYRMGSKALTAAVQSYAVTGDSQYYDNYMKELNEDKNRDIAWAGLEQNDIKSDEWAKLEQIAQLSNGLVPLEESAMASVQDGDTQSAIEYVFGSQYGETIEQINSLTDETISAIQSRLQKKKTTLTFIEVLVAVFFLLSYAYLIRQTLMTTGFAQKELLQPIIKVSDQMTQLAAGELHSEFDMQGDDSEVGRMVAAIQYMKTSLSGIIGEISAILEQMGQGNYMVTLHQQYVGDYKQIEASFHKIVSDMKETVTTIQDASAEINTGAGQLEEAAENLAEACTSQAGQVAEVSVLTDELNEIITVNRKEAEEAVKISNLSGSTLSAGNAKMGELKEAITEISHCSEQINSIIGTIEDIASQTNLLALNAAIEAARAGEAGKGFAVVAEQVKQLAEESSRAAGKTTELIENTIQAVQNGTGIADEAAANMEDVMMSSIEVGERVQRIVGKFEQEETSIGKINDYISQIAGIVDNNSATSEETAAISEEQKTHAEAMVELTGNFIV